MSRRWRWRIGIAILCVAMLPLAALAVLVPLALIGDCTVTAAATQSCIVFGADLGEPLAKLGVFAAWGVLITGPLALLLAALWGAAELGLWIGNRLTRPK